jgi:D-alanyl-D-alanine dipeptidase
VTEDYFLDVGGSVSDAAFTTFDFDNGSTEVKQNSREFQVLSNLAKDFGGVKYDLKNQADRKMFKRRLLMTLHPKAVEVLEEIARAYKQKFNRPLRVTSMNRSLEYQFGLNRTDPNSFRVRSNNSLPPHTTGLAFDLARKQMTAEEQNFVLQKLGEMERGGRIDGLIEYGANACFHVFVYPDGKPPKMK